MFKKLFISYFILISTLFATDHWNEEQVVEYVHNSALQQRSTWQLLSKFQFKGNEKVLDVGCGDGRVTSILSCLVRQGSVTGIDPTDAMLTWAKKQYHPLEFPNIMFLEGDANHIPDEQFDVITSFFSLHMVTDKKEAIKAFYDHLNPEGYVIAVIPPGPKNFEFGEATKETMQDPKWSPYLANFKTTFKFANLEEYLTYFKAAGFTVLIGENVDGIDSFVNKEEAIKWFIGTWPQTQYIPKELRHTFYSELLDKYIKKRPAAYSNDGVLSFYWGRFEVLVQKPEKF